MPYGHVRGSYGLRGTVCTFPAEDPPQLQSMTDSLVKNSGQWEVLVKHRGGAPYIKELVDQYKFFYMYCILGTDFSFFLMLLVSSLYLVNTASFCLAFP